MHRITVNWLKQCLDQTLGHTTRIYLPCDSFGLSIPLIRFRLDTQMDQLLNDKMLIETLESFKICVAFFA